MIAETESELALARSACLLLLPTTAAVACKTVEVDVPSKVSEKEEVARGKSACCKLVVLRSLPTIITLEPLFFTHKQRLQTSAWRI